MSNFSLSLPFKKRRCKDLGCLRTSVFFQGGWAGEKANVMKRSRSSCRSNRDKRGVSWVPSPRSSLLLPSSAFLLTLDPVRHRWITGCPRTPWGSASIWPIPLDLTESRLRITFILPGHDCEDTLLSQHPDVLNTYLLNEYCYSFPWYPLNGSCLFTCFPHIRKAGGHFFCSQLLLLSTTPPSL